MIKNIFLAILCIFFPLETYAFQDYIIMSDFTVCAISWSDDEVVSAMPVLTLDNRKNTIILKAKKEGNAIISIDTENGIKNIDVRVTKDKTTLANVEGFSYFELDIPAEGHGSNN